MAQNTYKYTYIHAYTHTQSQINILKRLIWPDELRQDTQGIQAGKNDLITITGQKKGSIGKFLSVTQSGFIPGQKKDSLDQYSSVTQSDFIPSQKKDSLHQCHVMHVYVCVCASCHACVYV